MNCKICNDLCNELFTERILNKYDVQYYQCSSCGFIQTEQAYWLSEAYSKIISSMDTGIMERNIFLSTFTTNLLILLGETKGQFLDYGGGLGIFTRLMRDRGFDFYWYDTNPCNYLAIGFEGDLVNKKYNLITAMECFEHFLNPIEEIERMLALTDTIFFTTELASRPASASNNWWYYCFEHGQHISIFTLGALEFIAKKYNLFLTTNGHNLHILSRNKISRRKIIYCKVMTMFGIHRLLRQESKANEDMRLIILKTRSS